MAKRKFKNYLRTYRKKLGISQREVAVVLGLASPNNVSLMERGLLIPTLKETITLRVIFNKRFEELWPGLNHAYEVQADNNIRDFMRAFEKDLLTSGRLEARAKILYKKLETIADGLPKNSKPTV